MKIRQRKTFSWILNNNTAHIAGNYKKLCADLMRAKVTKTMQPVNVKIKSKCLCTTYTLACKFTHTHTFRRGVAGVRVLTLWKNGNCISLADLGLGAKSLKLQLVSHNPLPSQQLSESLGPQQEVMGAEGRRSEWRPGGRRKSKDR